MDIPVKSLKNGFTIPVMGIGTWEYGGLMQHDPENDDASDIKALRTAIEEGFTHINTAEVYAAGYNEVLVRRAIKDYPREKFFITTKVSPRHLQYDDVIKAAKGSLKRLGIDQIDLYQIHYPNKDIPLKSTMKAMDFLVESGLIRFIGVSNFDVPQLQEAQSYCSHKVVVNEVQYNLKFRQPELNGIIKYCRENDVIIFAWKPIQKGLLTRPGIPVLDEVAEKYGKTQAQVAINWLLSQENIVTMVKMKSTDHIQENLGALGWELSLEDIETLRKEFPDQKHHIETAMDSYPPHSL